MIFNHTTMDSYAAVVTQQLLFGFTINQGHSRRNRMKKNKQRSLLSAHHPNVHDKAFLRLIKPLSLSALRALWYVSWLVPAARRAAMSSSSQLGALLLTFDSLQLSVWRSWHYTGLSAWLQKSLCCFFSPVFWNVLWVLEGAVLWSTSLRGHKFPDKMLPNVSCINEVSVICIACIFTFYNWKVSAYFSLAIREQICSHKI